MNAVQRDTDQSKYAELQKIRIEKTRTTETFLEVPPSQMSHRKEGTLCHPHSRKEHRHLFTLDRRSKITEEYRAKTNESKKVIH